MTRNLEGTCIGICITLPQRRVMNAWYVSFQAFHLHSKTVPRFLSTNLVPYDNKNRFDFILITPRPGLITSRYFARQAAILSLWFRVKRFSYFYGKSIHHLRGSASYCRTTRHFKGVLWECRLLFLSFITNVIIFPSLL